MGFRFFSSAGIGELFLDQVGINIILSNELIERRCQLHEIIYPKKKKRFFVVILKIQKFLKK